MSKIGRMVKERGHALEGMFNSLFNRRQKTLNLTGASSDCFITDLDTLKKLEKLFLQSIILNISLS